MGNLGGDDILRTRTVKDRWSHSPAAGRSCSSSWRPSASSRSSSPVTTRTPANPGGARPPIAPQGNYNPAVKPAYLDYARTLRGFLDEFGLEAIGNHGFIPGTWPGGPNGGMDATDEARYLTELEFASILGTPYMGTGNDPTNANDRNIEAWTLAGEKWDALNELSINSFGIQLYPHNHSPAYHFLQDGEMVEVTEDRQTGLPITPTMVRAESGKRLMQHYLDVTSPDLCVVELDIYWAHVAQHQWRWRYDENGDRVEDIFDPLAQVQAADETVRAVPREGRRQDHRTARRRQRLHLRSLRRPAQRHRLRDVLQEPGREGLP